ncbi:hypothetical protein [Micromonospora sp. KLBMP9576]|uniref:hypothetical protein n=1 Tax=Micromonospora sp. KLBMP9576 TaxID=3424769 RepID=UPI003D9465CA
MALEFPRTPFSIAETVTSWGTPTHQSGKEVPAMAFDIVIVETNEVVLNHGAV